MMSSYDDEFRTGSVPSAARVGADLRAARERLGWTLADIAANLRIRLPFLEAIEEGRTADLPGNAYAVGFIRTYAQALGLDPDEIARRFRAEAAEANRKTELKFPAPVPERGIPAGAIVLVGALIAVAAYAGWYRMSGNSRTATPVVQTVPERLAPLAEKPAPPAAVPKTQPPAQVKVAEGPEPAMPVVLPSSAAAAVAPAALPPAPVAAPAASAPLFGPPAPGTTAVPPVAVATAAPASVPPGTASASATPANATPASATVKPEAVLGHIVLRAKSDAWMQVREKGGQVIFNRVLRAGETWVVPAKPSLLLTTGNAAGTEILMDGVSSGPLGADGAVRRDIPLDVEVAKDTKPVAVPAKKS